MSRRESGSATLLYDADCGFCRRSIERIKRWDGERRLRVVALQSPEADELLGGMDPQERTSSWHLVEEDGTIHSGGAAVAPLLRLLRGGRPLASVADAFPGTTDRLYRLVARNRGRLGRFLAVL